MPWSSRRGDIALSRTPDDAFFTHSLDWTAGGEVIDLATAIELSPGDRAELVEAHLELIESVVALRDAHDDEWAENWYHKPPGPTQHLARQSERLIRQLADAADPRLRPGATREEQDRIAREAAIASFRDEVFNGPHASYHTERAAEEGKSVEQYIDDQIKTIWG